MIDKNSFSSRHIGPRNDDIKSMLNTIGCDSLDHLIKKTVPSNILFDSSLNLKPGMSEEFNKINISYFLNFNNIIVSLSTDPTRRLSRSISKPDPSSSSTNVRPVSNVCKPLKKLVSSMAIFRFKHVHTVNVLEVKQNLQCNF